MLPTEWLMGVGIVHIYHTLLDIACAIGKFGVPGVGFENPSSTKPRESIGDRAACRGGWWETSYQGPSELSCLFGIDDQKKLDLVSLRPKQPKTCGHHTYLARQAVKDSRKLHMVLSIWETPATSLMKNLRVSLLVPGMAAVERRKSKEKMTVYGALLVSNAGDISRA